MRAEATTLRSWVSTTERIELRSKLDKMGLEWSSVVKCRLGVHVGSAINNEKKKKGDSEVAQRL